MYPNHIIETELFLITMILGENGYFFRTYSISESRFPVDDRYDQELGSILEITLFPLWMSLISNYFIVLLY